MEPVEQLGAVVRSDSRCGPVRMVEVDRNAAENDIVDAEALRVLWRQELDRRVAMRLGEPWPGTIIPGVEAGYRGSLPTLLLTRAVVMRTDYSVVADLGAMETIQERTIDMLLET